MSLDQFTTIKAFSNLQILDEIKKSENELIKLQLKKKTRQLFKSHEVKLQKYYIVQLKTILTLRLYKLARNQVNTFQNIL